MFDQPLKSQSANNSLRITGATRPLKDSPFLTEGIAGIINNLDLYKDLPLANTQNNTPLRPKEQSTI